MLWLEREEIKRGKGNCIYYHIGKIAGKERVFIISDLFPVTTNYIVKPYTISSIEYIVKNEKMNKEIKRKTLKYLRLLEQHQLTALLRKSKLRRILRSLSISND